MPRLRQQPKCKPLGAFHQSYLTKLMLLSPGIFLFERFALSCRHIELLRLTDQIEQREATRVAALAELARLRGATSLDNLALNLEVNMRHRAMVMLAFFGGFALFLLIGLFLVTISAVYLLGYAALGLAFLLLVAVGFYSLTGYIQPTWTKRLAQSGREAKAIVIENNAVKGIGSYQGPDVWLKLPVNVQPSDQPVFEAQMTCRLSQTLMLRAGSEVTVRYDPSNKSKVVLVGNPMTDMMTKYMR